MVLESTMICVDNSDYMRNGDFVPTRFQAQQDAVNLVCHSKTRSNPENNVGLISLADSRVEVLTTLTSDVGRILSKLHQVQPGGEINLPTGIRIAHLALKHRQGKNHKMRIVVFVGSPVTTDEKELVKLAKRLKKEKVSVDVISFGEESHNSEVLSAFVNTLNGKDGTASHLVTVPPGPLLADALLSSPVIQGEDGAGGSGLASGSFEFGVDPNEDPELALALRVSMEEQRQRQQQDARRAEGDGSQEGESSQGANEQALLERALAMSMETDSTPGDSTAGSSSTASTDATPTTPAPTPVSARAKTPDFGSMTEDEQIAFAMRMSLQDAITLGEVASTSNQNVSGDQETMEVDESTSSMDTSELKEGPSEDENSAKKDSGTSDVEKKNDGEPN